MALAGDHVQVLVDGYELTGDHNKVAIDDSRKLLEATSFGMSGQRFIPGQRLSKLQHSGYLNPDAASSHPVLKGIAIDGVISVLVGQNDDPAVGNIAYMLLTQQELYQTKPEVGSVIPFSANFAPREGQEAGWGVALAVPVSFTDSITGSNVDNGAASSNGGAAFLHILQAAASDTYEIEVEGSADGSTGWGQVALFTLDASALGSERIAIAGSIPRYLRYKATRTGVAGDTVRLAVSVVRF